MTKTMDETPSTIPSGFLARAENATHLFQLAFQYGDTGYAQMALSTAEFAAQKIANHRKQDLIQKFLKENNLDHDSELRKAMSTAFSSLFQIMPPLPQHEIPAAMSDALAMIQSFDELTGLKTMGFSRNNPLKDKNAAWLSGQRLAIIDMAVRAGGNFFAGPNDYNPNTGLGALHLGDFAFQDKGRDLMQHPEIQTRIILHTLDHARQAACPWIPDIPQMFAESCILPHAPRAIPRRQELAHEIEETVHRVARRLKQPESQMELCVARLVTPAQKKFWSTDYKIDVNAMPYSTPEFMAQIYDHDRKTTQILLSDPLVWKMLHSGEWQASIKSASLIESMQEKSRFLTPPPSKPER